jgi:integrase
MAAIQQRSGRYRVLFRYHGKQHSLNLGKVSEAEAETKAGQVDYLLMRLRQGLTELPPGTDIVRFVRHDGVVPQTVEATPARKPLVLGELRDRYLATYARAIERNTLETSRTHFRHLISTLGEQLPLAELRSFDLQRHIDRRADASISPVTIRKELATLGTAWNWALRTAILTGPYPNKGLVYPKIDEKPPFQTMEAIERQIRWGHLNSAQERALWECLFLTLPDIAGLLKHIRTHARHPWIYPMAACAAHTGARRSELIRAQVADVDFEGEALIIREKKRKKGQRTTRRAPLSPFLASVLKAWLANHPGGPYVFCHGDKVGRSKKRSRSTGHQGVARTQRSVKGQPVGVRLRERPSCCPLTENEAHGDLKRTLRESKWRVVRGWHVLRHSFISCCAAAGVDQRFIDEWVDHTSEDMRRRYRHMMPSAHKQAIRAVFG